MSKSSDPSLLDLPVACLNARWVAKEITNDTTMWASVIENRTRGIDRDQVERILRGQKPSDRELSLLADLAQIEDEEFATAHLFSGDRGILAQNISYLLDQIPSKMARVAAQSIGVHQAQISRWRSGDAVPHKANLTGLLKFHGLDVDEPIETEPIFLSMDPVSSFAQKNWLKKRIEALPAREISKIFPALKKLLREDESH